MKISQESKTDPTYDPAIPCLTIDPKNTKIMCHRDVFAALLIIAELWNQCGCPRTEEWIRPV